MASSRGFLNIQSLNELTSEKLVVFWGEQRNIGRTKYSVP